MKKLSGLFSAVLAAIAFSAGIGAAHAQGCNRNVDIINNTCCTDIYSFQASPSGQDAWGPDQLDNLVIPPGYKKRFWMNDGSNYRYFDFRAVMSNGEVETRYHVDVCSTTSWTIYN